MDKPQPENWLQEIMDRQEDLHPDLADYLDEAGSLGICLRHPLVFGVPYVEQFNYMYNEQYRAKTEYLQKATNEKDWGSWIFIHEKPYRFEKLLELVEEQDLPIKTFWELFGNCWIDTENMWQMDWNVRELLNFDYPDPHLVMSEDEKKVFDALPEEFVVYRGHQAENQEGLSWTLSPWRAQWFANRWDRKDAQVSVATCSKAAAIGLFLGRSEFEIGVLPEELDNLRDLEPIQRSPFITNMRALAEKQFKLGKNSYHGPWHWDNVERNALALCSQTPGADTLVCQLFANLHDCCRLDEDEDPKHGPRAAGFIKKLYQSGKLDINPTQFNQLFHAIYHHTDGVLHDDPTIGVCWDADRMDLTRVNKIPDPAYFSTPAVGELLWRV